MKFTALTLGLALALGTASAAQAGESEDYAGCDGLKKPKKKDDGMRGVASLTGQGSYSNLFGAPSSKPLDTLMACNRALANPKLLATQAFRRAHLLRARAAAQLEMGDHTAALADLDRAQGLVADRAGDPFFARSMGASLTLLRALAKAGLGETAEAAELAGQAASLRPYALQIQLAASAIRGEARTDDASLAEASQVLRLEPRAATQLILRAHDRGDFAAVRRLAPEGLMLWGGSEDDAPAKRFVIQIDNAFLNALAATFSVAYAEAVAGHGDLARQRMEEVRARLALLSAGGNAGAEITKVMSDRIAAPRFTQVEARLALEEEGPEAALARIVDAGLPADAATLELFTALRDRAPEGLRVPDAAAIAAEVAKEGAADLGRIAPSLLIAPESARKLIDYKQSRPNILAALVGAVLSMGTRLLGWIERTTGFRSTANPDGTTTIEYVGATNSGPMVQEMTLLRAAELAREAGKGGFAIVERKDYQRFMATTQYGVEISRVPSGYKTELTVRFLDGEPAPAAFDAVAVIDDLGPLYYES